MHPDYLILNQNALIGYIIPPDDSVAIEVSFRPTSEYPPYGNCPLIDSFFVNFRPEDGIATNTTKS